MVLIGDLGSWMPKIRIRLKLTRVTEAGAGKNAVAEATHIKDTAVQNFMVN
jgi:hypothetical protein